MYKVIKIIVCCFFAMSFACDDISREPDVDKNHITMNKDGGEIFVYVKQSNGSAYKDLKAPWFYKPSVAYPLTTETLPSGELMYYNDWVSFIVSIDFKKIKVITKKNDTRIRRKFIFTGLGLKSGFYITVLQNP